MGMCSLQGTVVIPNLTSVLFEEGQWKSPREFNPENFLNDKGEFVKPEAFMPFSIGALNGSYTNKYSRKYEALVMRVLFWTTGTRVCLGEALARMELFLFLVTILRRYKFIWPEDAGEPDYTPVYGTTQTPKPYNMKVQLRGTAW